MRFSQIVRARRRRLGLTQAAVASSLGVTRERVTQIERGHAPSLQLAVAMGELYGLDLGELPALLREDAEAGPIVVE